MTRRRLTPHLRPYEAEFGKGFVDVQTDYVSDDPGHGRIDFIDGRDVA